MKALFILNDPPYGNERTYTALRLANNLTKKDESAEVTVFLMGDAVSAAKAGQQTPNGYYNLERMLKALVGRGGKVFSAARAWMPGGWGRRSCWKAAAGALWTSLPSSP